MTSKEPTPLKDFESSVEDLYRSYPVAMRDKPVISVMEGWHGLIADCAFEIEQEIARMPPEVDPEYVPRITDVKEKYGSLRITVSCPTQEIMDITARYEEESMRVCETCGRPGRLTKKGWITTACMKHE